MRTKLSRAIQKVSGIYTFIPQLRSLRSTPWPVHDAMVIETDDGQKYLLEKDTRGGHIKPLASVDDVLRGWWKVYDWKTVRKDVRVGEVFRKFQTPYDLLAANCQTACDDFEVVVESNPLARFFLELESVICTF